jgi:large subunit ribosomal protein L18
MNITKKERRSRRATKTRAKIRELGTPRLTVHRTPRHIYAQLFAADGSQVLAAASTVQKELAKDLKYTGNIEAARVVGRAIAERAKAAGIEKAAFDRSGFQYHGRVKALADAARESGLEF